MTDRSEPHVYTDRRNRNLCDTCDKWIGNKAHQTDRAEPGVTPLTASELARLREDLRLSDPRGQHWTRLRRLLATLDAATPPGLVEALRDIRHSVQTNLTVTDRNVTGQTDYYAGKAAAFRIALGIIDRALASGDARLANDKGADPTPEPK